MGRVKRYVVRKKVGSVSIKIREYYCKDNLEG